MACVCVKVPGEAAAKGGQERRPRVACAALPIRPAGEGHKAAKSKVREERVAGISKVRATALIPWSLLVL